MRCAQIDSFPQNPAEPIPAGRASPCWHIVAWFGTTAYPLSLSYDRANPGRFPLPYRASSRTVRDNGRCAVPFMRRLSPNSGGVPG